MPYVHTFGSWYFSTVCARVTMTVLRLLGENEHQNGRVYRRCVRRRRGVGRRRKGWGWGKDEGKVNLVIGRIELRIEVVR